MKIAICSSLDFIEEIKNTADALRKLGHEVTIPITAEKIFAGEVLHEDVMDDKKTGEFANRGIKYDALRYYYGKIKETDAILVLNLEKKNIKGYVGGAVFLEMGFTHVLGKKIYLFDVVPEVLYVDEIRMMQPIVINSDLSKIV